MPKRTSSYRIWQLQKLSDPEIAANYLNEAYTESPALLLKAIRNVAQARGEIASVAKEAGVARENLYRAFSEQGNPTFGTFISVLQVLGVKFEFSAVEHANHPLPTSPNDTSHLAMLGESQNPQQISVVGTGRGIEQQELGPHLAYVNPARASMGAGKPSRLRTLRSTGKWQNPLLRQAVR